MGLWGIDLAKNKKRMANPTEYSKSEETLNIISHGIGFLFAFLGTFLLYKKAVETHAFLAIISVTIYGLSMIILYGSSTMYHWSINPKWRYRLQILDHSSIYLLIAGTYTPFALLTIGGTLGWVIFGLTWALALIGIILKLFYTGRFNIVSTIMYVVMGWNIAFAIVPLIDGLTWNGFYFLLAGGIAYTFGALLFVFEKLSFNHAIFHLFVLLGTALQYISVYYYVL